MIIPDESEKAPTTRNSLIPESSLTSSTLIPGPNQAATQQSAQQDTMLSGDEPLPPPYEAGNVVGQPTAPISSSNAARPSSTIFSPNVGTSREYYPPSKTGTSPPSFSRQAPSSASRASFNTMYLTSNKSKLAGGFPVCPPPIQGESLRHPFAERDITEEDWNWFLQDVNNTAALKESDKTFSRHIPIITIVPFVTPVLNALGQQYAQARKGKPVTAMIDRWNHHFFAPRHVEVVFMKGPERLSGNLTSPAPSLGSPTAHPGQHSNADSDSDSDSDDADDSRQPQPSTKGVDTKYDPVDGPVSSSSTSPGSFAAGSSHDAARGAKKQRKRETTSIRVPLGGGLGMRDKLYRLVVVPI